MRIIKIYIMKLSLGFLSLFSQPVAYREPEKNVLCPILFINFPKKEAIANLNGRSVLTISNNNNFIRQGAMIELFRRGSRMALSINTQSTKKWFGNGNSKLLRIADLVKYKFISTNVI